MFFVRLVHWQVLDQDLLLYIMDLVLYKYSCGRLVRNSLIIINTCTT